MPPLPEFQATQNVGGAPELGVRAVPIMDVPSPGKLGAATAALGAAGTEFAAKFAVAKQAAAATNALAAGLVKLDAEKTERINDTDWQNAPDKWKENSAKVVEDALGSYNFDPATKATLNLHLQHAVIHAGDQVGKAALVRGGDAWLGDYTTISQQNQNDASVAPTPAARQNAIDRNDAMIATGQNAGWIGPGKAAELKHNFSQGLDHADAMRAVSADPRAADAKLADPNNFPTLSVTQREMYREQAREKIDRDAIEHAKGIVSGEPYKASLVAGQFVDSAHVGALFEKGVVPAESNGKNAPPNAKGAFGPAQITPGFARDYLPRLSPEAQAVIGDVSKMSDKELTDKLMEHPEISTAIGKAGFRALAEKYNGNTVLTLAAYNAGPVAADRWKASAEKQFGPNPTPEQIASVIDFKETRDYVGKIYGNAPLNAFGVSPAGRYNLGTALGTELQTQATRDQHILNQIASVTASSDPTCRNS
jgi:hypothetical protein